MIGHAWFLSLMLAMISCRIIKYRYPAGQARELARAGVRPDHYPARIPGYQHPLEMATRIAGLKPTATVPLAVYEEAEESWDATETVWVTEVDPQLARTVIVIATQTLAKLINLDEDAF